MREKLVYEWAVEMIVEMIVLVCKGCHVYSERDLQNKYKLREVRFTYDDAPNHDKTNKMCNLLGKFGKNPI